MDYKYYMNPKGVSGIGSDIKWCSRPKGRKKCDLCFRYVSKEIWTKEWHWFYLHTWFDISWVNIAHAHFKLPKYYHSLAPSRYRSTGLKEFELKKLLNKGCSLNKKCRCINIIQRSFWYCETCHNTINTVAKIENVHPHDIMLTGFEERNELKAKILILRLSGSI